MNDNFDARAAEIAPCNCEWVQDDLMERPNPPHIPDCPAYYRPAIAAFGRECDRKAREVCAGVVNNGLEWLSDGVITPGVGPILSELAESILATIPQKDDMTDQFDARAAQIADKIDNLNNCYDDDVRAQIKDLIAAALRKSFEDGQKMNWRPIKTAPKSKKHDLVIVYHPAIKYAGGPKYPYYVTEAYPIGQGEWYSESCNVRFRPTHWMPKPKPPDRKVIKSAANGPSQLGFASWGSASCSFEETTTEARAKEK